MKDFWSEYGVSSCAVFCGLVFRFLPETFVEPVFGRGDFNFELPCRACRSVVGGGWREADPGKVYYVVAVLSD